jgi:cellulose synthase operon protein C
MAASWLTVALAAASPAPAQSEDETADETRPDVPARLSLVGRFGVARLERWLSSDDPAARLRAIERLGELGDVAARAKLTNYAFERRAQLGGRECLALARALAPHAADAKVLLVLAMLLNQSPSKTAGPEEAGLSELWRGAAALALAADGSEAALLALGRALRTAGTTAALAADALLAHPPEVLVPLLDAPGEPTPALARLLGELGDQRAFHSLRGWVRGGSPEVRAAAAVALTRLGHFETVPLGALWLGEGSAELRRAGLEILLLAQDPRAEALLRGWVEGPGVDAEERALLLDYPSPAFAPALVASLERGEPDGGWRWALLGRVGGPAAAAQLVKGLEDESSAFAAAHALSRFSGDEVQAPLAAALSAGVAPGLGLRSAALRGAASAERYPSLEARYRALARSELPVERAAAAWAHSLAGGRAAIEELTSGDALRVAAAASNVLWFEDAVCEAALQDASRAEPGTIRTALAACLRAPPARRLVTSDWLWSLVAEAGVARPIALRVLAERSDPGLWAALTSYLDHSDPLVREHVARGLGESGRPSAVGYLVRRFAYETDEGVRRAIVVALASQSGRAARRWLELAARLDPSPRVRTAARLASGGVRLADPGRGGESLWVRLVAGGAGQVGPDASSPGPAESGAAPPSAAPPPGLPALVSVAPGLAIPVFADPAGLLVIPGLPVTHLGIRLQ